jgi:dTDP-4-dehydrorhamnose reductase
MRLLVTGGAGYLGSEVCARAEAEGIDVIATQLHAPAPHGHAIGLDLRDEEAVHRAFLKYGPDVVVHTAYRQATDALEGDVLRATRNVAGAADRLGARTIHLSTDLVFDGEHGAPYSEDDEPRPVSPYGQAKLEAEAFVHGLVVRTSLLVGKPGPQEALAARPDVVFHADEIRCPTNVFDLAGALVELAAIGGTGVLHVAGPDAVSRLELAQLLGARDPKGGPTPPGRARNVALDSSRAVALLATKIRGIQGGLLHS